MRQLLVQVPRGHGADVTKIADGLHALNTVTFEGVHASRPVDIVITNVSNRRVEAFLEQVEELPDVHVSFYPMGSLALKPPSSEAADQVTDVEPLSPIEVFLAGHQSIGSWRGFLGYAAAAGAVVWVGLYVGSDYLLTAAMLVAPFAGPAMNAAIATSTGEAFLLRRSLLRYVAALAVTVAVSWVLTWLIGPASPSPRMVSESQVSAVAVILPLVAGAAGAVFLQTSERSSLVSGAAVGLLVAASLAPPAGIVGMAAALGRWDMAGTAVFVLALQLVGIHLSGAVVFRLFGMTHEGARFSRGGSRMFPVGLAGTVALLAGLLFIQFRDPVHLQRSSLAQDMASTIEQEIAQTNLHPEEITARFMQTTGDRPPVLVAEVLVHRPEGPEVPLDSTEEALAAKIQRRIAEARPDVVPALDIRWLRSANQSPVSSSN